MDFKQLAQALNPFTDKRGETYIQVAVEGSKRKQQVPIDTPLARSVIRSMLCGFLKRGYPTDHETRIAVEVIVGLAFTRKRHEAKFSADHQIARHPLAQTVLVIARKGGTKKDPASLLGMLTRVALREDIDIKKGPWPTNEIALGKQLAGLRKVLAAKGVRVVRHKNDRPRKWSISPTTEAPDGRDGEVTHATANETRPSAEPDTSPPSGGLTDEEMLTQLNGEPA